MRAWVVRGGRKGRFEDAALSEGVVILGWEEIPDLSSYADPYKVRMLVGETYPGKSAYVTGNWAGQLWRFRGEIAKGDLIVLPRVGSRLAIGCVTGGYEWRPVPGLAAAHVRKVEWLRPDVPRTAAQSDLRDSLGSLLTVYELRRNNAAARISALAEDGVDSGGLDVDVSTVVFGSTQELLDAAAARENGDPIVLAVRSLLQLWGAQRRGSAVVEQIQRDLAATGLTTRPPFTDGGINGTVAIVPLDVDPDETEPETVAEETGLPPVSYLVGNLASAMSDVMSAQADEALGQAIVRMRENNFSQLPVLSPDGTLKGALTWQSIAATVHQGVAQTRVADAITHASTAYASDSCSAGSRTLATTATCSSSTRART